MIVGIRKKGKPIIGIPDHPDGAGGSQQVESCRNQAGDKRMGTTYTSDQEQSSGEE